MTFILIAYLITVVLGYGLQLHYWQNKPSWWSIRDHFYRSDVMTSVGLALLGPMAVISAILMCVSARMPVQFMFWRKGAW